MRFVAITWKNVYRRRTRSLLTICGLAVAVAAVISLVGVTDSFPQHFADLYRERDIDIVVQRYGPKAELSISLPENLGDRIRKLPHVTAVIGGMTAEIPLQDQNLPAVIINGWPNSSPLFDEAKFLEGRRLHTGDYHKLDIGQALAKKTGTKIGDTLKVYGAPYQIVGIYASKSIYENNAMVTLLPDMQDALKKPNEVIGFVVRTDISKEISAAERSAELAKVRQNIEALDPDHSVAATEAGEFVKNVGVIRAARAFAWAVSAIALVLGAILMLNTMIMSVFERIREIGTLRAVGWRRFQVVRMILVESLLLSIGGAVLGSLAAAGMTYGLSKMPWASGFIAGDIAPIVFVQGCIAALVVGVGSAIYPAIWGAGLSPVEAMRRK